jgi:flavin-dependent thymidylate synthase
MEVKLIGNGTKESVINAILERIDELEKQSGKVTKSELVQLVEDFALETKNDLSRPLDIEDRMRVVSTAGQLSREKGTVLDVYERRTDAAKNQKLATNVIGYGHKTISEHDYLVFALQDVSRFVEQTLISYRLTSFTIKSGRNVDFRTAGYYVPDFRDKDGKILPNNTELRNMYTKYMDTVFAKYGEYVDDGVPVEEARYALPFGYKTNIVMGCDANEFFRITCDLLYGKSDFRCFCRVIAFRYLLR